MQLAMVGALLVLGLSLLVRETLVVRTTAVPMEETPGAGIGTS